MNIQKEVRNIIRVISLAAILVLSTSCDGGGGGTADTSQGQLRSLEWLMMEAREAPDPLVRAAALEDLADQYQGVGVLDTLVAGLQDEEPRVREVALEGLKQVSGDVPIEPLAEVALEDPNPELRMEALRLSAETCGETALDTLKQGVLDPDPQVSDLAQDMLEELTGEE